MMRSLSILYVAYPLLAVTEESAGGAEQMLLTLEREMNARGHRTTVAAAEGSRISGRLLATGAPAGGPDQYEAREREHKRRILEYLRRHPHDFDLIHDKSGSFFREARQCSVPMLATLHLPRGFYPDEWFRDRTQLGGQTNATNPLPGPTLAGRQPAWESRPSLHFNCVSQSQARSFAGCANVIGVVENGIAVERCPFTRDKDGYLLWLGRICEEKAPHLAIAAAQRAGMPLVIAGQVYPFSYHQAYFERAIRPHLDGRQQIRFVDTPLSSQKLHLLSHARALLLTSTVEETSSLVAMEAMACGTPVMAFRRGAFPEIVADAETGFIVDKVEEMASALKEAGRISPETCRAHVEHNFRASRMAQDYEELYRRVLAGAKELAA